MTQAQRDWLISGCIPKNLKEEFFNEMKVQPRWEGEIKEEILSDMKNYIHSLTESRLPRVPNPNQVWPFVYSSHHNRSGENIGGDCYGK